LKIDKLNQQIILNLQTNGRLSFLELAKMLDVSEGTIRKRVSWLLAQGVIRVTAIPDLDKLGYKFMSIVGLQIRLADLRNTAEQLAKYPNICYLANVTGRYEFIAIIFARSSKEYSDFMENVISRMASIVRTETFVNLNIYKGHGNWLDTTQIISSLFGEVLE